MNQASLLTRLRGRKAETVEQTAALPPEVSLHGEPLVKNEGQMQFGTGVVIRSHPERTHLVVGTAGHLRVGARVRFGQGVALSCLKAVSIGDDSVIGAYTMVADSDFHVVGEAQAAPIPEPISIGSRVVVGEHTVIMPGSTIGDDVTISPGSVVSGRISTGSSVAGNPAVPAAAANATELSVKALFGEVFGLQREPTAPTSIDDIEDWDSLGALRLLVAFEAQYGVTVDERQAAGLTTVGHWENLLTEHRREENGQQPGEST